MPRRLDWNSSALFADTPYRAALRDHPAALGDAVPPNLDKLEAALSTRHAHIEQYIDRMALVESLRRSHEQRGAPQPVFDAIERLRADNAYLVIAGQQPGLLGGPLLTWYKALHAIALARRLSKLKEETFLPAFWNASEDHDPSEINTVTWLSKARTLETFIWNLPDGKRPYFAIPTTECPLEALRQRILETTHPSEFREAILDDWTGAAAQAQNYPDLFDQWMWSWLGKEGLIILRPDDAFLREASAPILRREIEEPLRATRSVEARGAILEQAGLPAQIHKREDRTAFFLLRNNAREAVFFRDGAFILESGETYTKDRLLGLLQDDPTRFSPSAILRPAIQDAILPCAAVILGPSELAYHFLLQGVYEAHGVPRPAVVPRFGFTLLESRDLKSMEKYQITLPDLREDASALLKRLVRAQEGELETAPVASAVGDYFETLKIRAQTIDPTIIPTLDKNLQATLKQLRNSEALLVRREAERHQAARNQIEALQAALAPHGRPQERTLSMLHYWLKYGPEFLRTFADLAMEIEDDAHVFIQVSP